MIKANLTITDTGFTLSADNLDSEADLFSILMATEETLVNLCEDRVRNNAGIKLIGAMTGKTEDDIVLMYIKEIDDNVNPDNVEVEVIGWEI